MFATYIPCVISWFGNKTLSSVEFNFNFRTTSDPAGNCIEILPKLNIIGIWIGYFKLFGRINSHSPHGSQPSLQLKFFMKSRPFIPSQCIAKFDDTMWK